MAVQALEQAGGRGRLSGLVGGGDPRASWGKNDAALEVIALVKHEQNLAGSQVDAVVDKVVQISARARPRHAEVIEALAAAPLQQLDPALVIGDMGAGGKGVADHHDVGPAAGVVRGAKATMIGGEQADD